MSLDRYFNIENLLSSQGQVFPSPWPDIVHDVGQVVAYPIPVSSAFVQRCKVEMHLYSNESDGAYVSGVYDIPVVLDNLHQGIDIPAQLLMSNLELRSGRYIAIFNMNTYRCSLSNY